MRICSVSGCGSPHYGNGFCKRHNKRFKLYGDPTAVAKRTGHKPVPVVCRRCGVSAVKPRRQVEANKIAGRGTFCSRACAAASRRMTDERFASLIMPEPNSGCWLWLGAIDEHGYGRIGGEERAHHRALKIAGRQLPPPGFETNHACRVHCCVNPDHLVNVTHRDNMLYGMGAAYQNARKTHCPQGHPYSGDNLQTRKVGSRVCRQCRHDRYARTYVRTSSRRSKYAEASYA